ncbi:MAG: hypothetical protein IJ796_03650 [Lachnospiraceae bacterium]|nr:hypothetical protein [Lachnospiraceae bacterium]
MKRINNFKKMVSGAAAVALAITFTGSCFAYEDNGNTYEWQTGENGKCYWYENGVRQGTYDDPKGVLGDGTIRGREIYDAESDGWYWLDSIYDGAKAVGKEVWMPYIYQDEDNWDDAKKAEVAAESGAMSECVLRAITEKSGKWVRYDENGKMLKGLVRIENELASLYPEQAGNVYYYDEQTGLMAKGTVRFDGVDHYFDETTGCMTGANMDQYRERFIDEANRIRKEMGFGSLETSDELNSIATRLAEESITNGYAGGQTLADGTPVVSMYGVNRYSRIFQHRTFYKGVITGDTGEFMDYFLSDYSDSPLWYEDVSKVGIGIYCSIDTDYNVYTELFLSVVKD